MWIAKRNVLTAHGWVVRGRVVPDGDPLLEGCEDAFDRLVEDGSPVELPVEQATAAPGEKRETTRRRRP